MGIACGVCQPDRFLQKKVDPLALVLVRAALDKNAASHPEKLFREDALLCSINERLGALLPPGVMAGRDFGPLDGSFLSEVVEAARLEAEEIEDATSKANPD